MAEGPQPFFVTPSTCVYTPEEEKRKVENRHQEVLEAKPRLERRIWKIQSRQNKSDKDRLYLDQLLDAKSRLLEQLK